MANLDSDAFVFFGATGDSGVRADFPGPLQAMIRRSHFNMPIIGVQGLLRASTSFGAVLARVLEKHGGLDPDAFAVLSAKAAVCQRRLRLPTDIPRSAKGAWRGVSASLLPCHTAKHVLRPLSRAWPTQTVTRARVWSSRNLLAAT